MYRYTLNINSGLKQTGVIFNGSIGRNRSISNHEREWHASPYQNKSYVIKEKGVSIIIHNGVLMAEFYYQNSVFKLGKAENSIAKKRYELVYPRNETALYKQYSKEYDLLMATKLCWGTFHIFSKKLRELHERCIK